MKLKEIKGLKYPDDYFIKYFFKNGFHKSEDLTFIEFGSSNGNNLMLPYQYEHNVIGIDIDSQAIDDANFNFTNLPSNAHFNFHLTDMREYANNTKNLQADAFLLPNIVNYIPREDFIIFLKLMMKNNNIKKNASIFIRCRTPKDFRFGIGTKEGYNAYRLDDDYTITGEPGCLNTFYTQYELISTLEKYLSLKDFQIFSCDFQNVQGDDTIVSDSDIILWGKIN
jgi:hypothetical protein